MFRKNMLDASPTYSSIMAASTYTAGRMSRLYYLLGLLKRFFFFKYVCMYALKLLARPLKAK